MKKFLRYLELLVPAIAALGASIVAAMIGIVIYYESYLYAFLYRRSLDSRYDISLMNALQHMPDITDAYIETMNYVIPILWLVMFFVWYRMLLKKEKAPNTQGKRIKLFTVKNIILLAIIALGLQLVTGGAMDLILPHFEGLMQKYSELMEEALGGNPIIVFISVVILAPFSEELIFRGVILKKATGIMPFIAANIVQALLFSLFHMNIVQGVYTFPAGLIMGYIAYNYKSIKASILFHMFFNALSYVLIEPTETYMMVIFMISGIILVASALFQVDRETSKNRIAA